MCGASEGLTFLPLSDVAFTHDGMEHIGRENVFAISPRCSDHHTSSRDFEQHLRMEEPHLRRKEVPGPPLMCTVNFDLVRKAEGRKFSSSLMPAVPARGFLISLKLMSNFIRAAVKGG